jgi:cytochrome oxidase Cu insertion factor (SCO1/SenC/PrrC family)
LEPADVDQKQLVKTALILVAIILVGAFAVTAGYFALTKKQSKTENFRPAFTGELPGHVMLQIADGTVTNTAEIEEDVWVFYQTTYAERESHEERDKALALLPDDGVREVVFFVDMDPNDEADRAQMAALSKEEGLWKVAGQAKVLEKFLKSELRFGTVPHRKNGEWIYDDSVAVLKRDHPEGKNPRIHIRGEMFDFDRAAKEADIVAEAGRRVCAPEFDPVGVQRSAVFTR